MAIWNPWRGCHKVSTGCLNCYIHKADFKKGIDTNKIIRTDDFDKLKLRNKNGEYIMKSGQVVFVCFYTDFFIEEADDWREEAWLMMKQRNDLTFFFLTKRIERFNVALPIDYPTGYEHITIAISVENQEMANQRIPVLKSLPIVHKQIMLQPMVGPIDLSPYLDKSIEKVILGGESGHQVRKLNRDWVVEVNRQCVASLVPFEYRMVGSFYVVNGVVKKVQKQYLCKMAREENLDFLL
jgi:protein gp37